jgi:hypothetical protein
MARKPKVEKIKSGRPPKNPADLQTECIMVRVTKVERRMLEREAKQAGCSLSAALMRSWREGK